MNKVLDNVGNGLLDPSLLFRGLGVAEAASNLVGNKELAGAFDNTACGVSVLAAASEGFQLPGTVMKCVNASQTYGFFSFKLLNRVRLLAGNIGGFFVSVGYALKLPGITTALTARVAPFLPLTDLLLHVNDMVTNALKIAKKEKSDLSRVEKNAFALRITQKKWELAKHTFLVISGLIAVVGITLAPGILFAVSIAAFALSMFAYFAKQNHNDFLSENKTWKIATN